MFWWHFKCELLAHVFYQIFCHLPSCYSLSMYVLLKRRDIFMPYPRQRISAVIKMMFVTSIFKAQKSVTTVSKRNLYLRTSSDTGTYVNFTLNENWIELVSGYRTSSLLLLNKLIWPKLKVFQSFSFQVWTFSWVFVCPNLHTN